MVPNLDAMNETDLMKFWNKYQNCTKRSEAEELIGDRRPGFTNIAKSLGAYASNKATAISCRTRGDISAAQVYEKIPWDCRW